MSDRLYVATRKGLFTVQRYGGRWQITSTSFLADAVYIVLDDEHGEQVYAALGHGHFGVKLHRSADRGATWTECTAPAYPPKPPDQEWRDPHGRLVPWNLELIWSLEVGGGPDELWCGTIPGGLFRSSDRGSSWNLVEALWNEPARKEWFGGGMDYPGIHSICVDPRDPRQVAVAVSCGGVWVTSDRGTSWTCRATGMWAAYMPPERKYDPHIQDPHRVVQCRRKPEVLWAQHHNGVFRSVDGAASWHEITAIAPSSFGFAVAVHPRDPDTAWFVPAQSDEKRIPVDARIVVARTRDGGRSFEQLSAGLPQQHAYDVTFRHGLDVDDTGECVAFGSTTGSLWISDDQGDTWECIATHLPPVYCLRFEKQWPSA